MTDKRLVRVDLLRSLLAPLVDEWGYQAVRDCLDESMTKSAAQPVATQTRQKKNVKTEYSEQALEKPTASSLAAKVSLPPVQKQLIEQLARLYDGKHFLPTSGDVRYFFEVHGQQPPAAKQRSEAFRKVLRLLSTMSEGALRKMIAEDTHSGPSRLAPLSEAMRGVGEQRSAGQSFALDTSANAPEDADLNRQVGADRPADA